jgi:hypothetical protein
MNAPNDIKKASLGAPVSVVRQQLLDDADTKEIAKAFKMPLEQYVDLVLMYAQNPDKDPILTILDEDEMQGEGADLPTQAQVLDWLNKVESGEIELAPTSLVKDVLESAEPDASAAKFAKPSEPPRASVFKNGAPKKTSSAGSALKQQLEAQRAKVHTEPK